MSLLEQALSVKVAKKNGREQTSDEMLELAIAYVRHEVTGKQIAAVLNVPHSAVVSRVFHSIASGVRSGRLQLVAG